MQKSGFTRNAINLKLNEVFGLKHETKNIKAVNKLTKNLSFVYFEITEKQPVRECHGRVGSGRAGLGQAGLHQISII